MRSDSLPFPDAVHRLAVDAGLAPDDGNQRPAAPKVAPDRGRARRGKGSLCEMGAPAVAGREAGRRLVGDQLLARATSTALSIKRAIPDLAVWATLSLGNIAGAGKGRRGDRTQRLSRRRDPGCRRGMSAGRIPAQTRPDTLRYRR